MKSGDTTDDRRSCEGRLYQTISHLLCEFLKTVAEYIPRGVSQNVAVS